MENGSKNIMVLDQLKFIWKGKIHMLYLEEPKTVFRTTHARTRILGMALEQVAANHTAHGVNYYDTLPKYLVYLNMDTGSKRMKTAEQVLAALRQYKNKVIVINNADKFLRTPEARAALDASENQILIFSETIGAKQLCYAYERDSKIIAWYQ
jgi:hypothetical protein